MPKAILEYDLEKPEDREEFAIACRARDLLITIEDLLAEIRKRVKHGDPDEDKNISGLEEARKMLFEIMEDRGVSGLLG